MWWCASLLLLLGCRPPDCAEAGVICTVAGTGQVGFNGLDQPADTAWLSYPSAVTWLAEGALLIVDYNNFVLRALEDDGALLAVAGSNTHGWAVDGPALDSPMENPIDAAEGPDGALWVVEQHTGRLLQVLDGQLSVVAGTGEYGYTGDGGPAAEATFGYLGGVEVVGDTVVVADTDNHALRAVDLVSGEVRTLAGDGEPGFVDGPGGQLNRPARLAADGDRLLIVDTGNHALRALDLTTGALSTLAGTGAPGYGGDGGPAEQATLYSPTGVGLGLDGEIYVADTFNNVVRVIDHDGQIETFAGSGEAGYAGDQGPAAEARLSWPADVAVDDLGQVYIADMRSSVIRRVGAP